MLYRVLADVVVAVHMAFVAFIPIGGFLAWRWRWLLWPHLAAVTWAVSIITLTYDCPLTPLEKELRKRSGEEPYEGGFVDHYIEGPIYPERYTPYLWAVAAGLIVASYAGLARRSRSAHPSSRLAARP